MRHFPPEGDTSRLGWRPTRLKGRDGDSHSTPHSAPPPPDARTGCCLHPFCVRTRPNCQRATATMGRVRTNQRPWVLSVKSRSPGERTMWAPGSRILHGWELAWLQTHPHPVYYNSEFRSLSSEPMLDECLSRRHWPGMMIFADSRSGAREAADPGVQILPGSAVDPGVQIGAPVPPGAQVAGSGGHPWSVGGEQVLQAPRVEEHLLRVFGIARELNHTEIDQSDEDRGRRLLVSLVLFQEDGDAGNPDVRLD